MKKNIQPNEKLITKDVRFLNVVLYPENRQSTQRYIELFTEIFDTKIAVNTYAEKITQMETLEQVEGMYFGKLVNFTDLKGKKWFDKDTNVVENFDFNLNKFPNAKEKEFYFLPSIHRIAVIGKNSPSLGQVQKFFQQAFAKVVDAKHDEAVEVNVITDSVVIDKIYSSQKLVSLELHVSYSNNDLNGDYQALIDDQMKEQEVRKFKSTVSGTLNTPLKIKKQSFLGGLLGLTQNNGYAIAKGDFDGTYQAVSTRDFPLSCKITSTIGGFCKALKEKMLSLLNRNV